MEVLLLGSKELLISGKPAQLQYYITQEGSAAGEAFGIAVKLFSETGEDASELSAISPDRERVRQIAALMLKNDVTPVSVQDIIDDLMLP